jgi:hypothetical protein
MAVNQAAPVPYVDVNLHADLDDPEIAIDYGCDDIAFVTQRFEDQDLSPAQQERFEEHLKHCRSCRESLLTLRPRTYAIFGDLTVGVLEQGVPV